MFRAVCFLSCAAQFEHTCTKACLKRSYSIQTSEIRRNVNTSTGICAQMNEDARPDRGERVQWKSESAGLIAGVERKSKKKERKEREKLSHKSWSELGCIIVLTFGDCAESWTPLCAQTRLPCVPGNAK